MATATIDPTITSEQVGAYYDQLAQYYRLVWENNLHVGYWLPDDPDAPLAVAQNNLTDLLISKTPVGPGQNVLDVGCGLGRPGVRLAEKTGCGVVGITISQVQTVEANRYAQERGIGQRASFHCVDAMKMPFADETFDAVWAFECLFHMPDRVEVLRQIARVLRPGGWFVLTDPYEKVLFTPMETKILYASFQVNAFFTPKEYQTSLSTLGIKVKDWADISENTHSSYTQIMAATSQKEAELRTIYGEEFIAQMQYIGPTLEAINRNKIGYLCLAAEKVG